MELALFTGNYKLTNDTINVSLKNKNRYMRQSRFPAVNYKALFVTNRDFEFVEIPGVRFTFVTKPGRKAAKITFLQGEKDFEAICID